MFKFSIFRTTALIESFLFFLSPSRQIVSIEISLDDARRLLLPHLSDSLPINGFAVECSATSDT